MAFQRVRSLIAGAMDVAPPADNLTFPMTSNTAAVAGTVYKFTQATGRIVLAAAASKDAAVICLESKAAVADVGGAPQVHVRCAWITPGTVYKAPITDKDGTALTTLDDGVYLGATLNINDTGTGVDGETDLTAVNGPLTVVGLTEDKDFAYVVFNTCLLAMDVDTV